MCKNNLCCQTLFSKYLNFIKTDKFSDKFSKHQQLANIFLVLKRSHSKFSEVYIHTIRSIHNKTDLNRSVKNCNAVKKTSDT